MMGAKRGGSRLHVSKERGEKRKGGLIHLSALYACPYISHEISISYLLT